MMKLSSSRELARKTARGGEKAAARQRRSGSAAPRYLRSERREKKALWNNVPTEEKSFADVTSSAGALSNLRGRRRCTSELPDTLAFASGDEASTEKNALPRLHSLFIYLFRISDHYFPMLYTLRYLNLISSKFRIMIFLWISFGWTVWPNRDISTWIYQKVWISSCMLTHTCLPEM